MKTIYWVLIISAILVVNNIVMLSWIERKQEVEVVALSAAQVDQTPVLTSGVPEMEDQATLTSSAEQLPPSDALTQAQGRDSELIAAFQRISRSNEFIDVLDNYQLGAQSRYLEIEKKLSRMNATELYSAALNSESLFERQYALRQLLQGKLGALENYELKKLYQGETFSPWSKTKILGELVDKGDLDGLVWAKEFMADNQYHPYLNSKLISGVYARDKDFVHRYLQDVDIENLNTFSSLSSVFFDEPELATEFFSNNFDKILESENDHLFKFGSYDVKFEMSNDQQSRLVDFFGDRSRGKRGFAIGLIDNISNVDLLRDGYNKLERKSDRVSFMRGLATNRNNSEKTALLRELASASDDPDIKKYADGSL